MKTGFLGRFQPFHLGHHKVIENREDNLVVLVGSPEKSREEDNPLTFEERKKLIEACHSVEIQRVRDTVDEVSETEPGDTANQKWAKKFEEKEIERVLTGNSFVREIIEAYTDLEVEEPETFNRDIYSGTEVRRRIRSGEEWRYLMPECCHGVMEELLEEVRKSGPQYEFKPGWKRENIQN